MSWILILFYCSDMCSMASDLYYFCQEGIQNYQLELMWYKEPQTSHSQDVNRSESLMKALSQ